jgi:hypothetical protein
MALKNRNKSFQGSMEDLLGRPCGRPCRAGHGAGDGRNSDRGPGRPRNSAAK